ncbi:hypothetical protein WJX82_005502 [Trebouxia sp. C0006]
MFIPVNGGQGISRPFVVGLILLLVFLGMQSDLVPSRPESSTEEAEAPAKDVTKERIILELSKSNERLEMLAVKSLNNFDEPLYRNARPGIWQDWDNYCLAS